MKPKTSPMHRARRKVRITEMVHISLLLVAVATVVASVAEGLDGFVEARVNHGIVPVGLVRVEEGLELPWVFDLEADLRVPLRWITGVAWVAVWQIANVRGSG